MRVGTDVFAGLVTVNGFHVLVGLKARGTSDPRKHLCLSALIGSTTLRPGAPRVGSMVLTAGVFAGLARGKLLVVSTDPTCIALMSAF